MASTMGRVDVFADRTAGGGSAIKMVTNATVEGLVTTPTAQRLTLRLRGDQFDGAPQAVVRVDNRQVASFAVPATRWTDYVVNVNWTAGPHTVAVGFVNDRYVRGVGDRNLRLDWVDFAGSGTVPAPLDDPYEARIVELVNAARTTAGLSRLTMSPCADRYAEDWSAHMATTAVMAHRTDLGTVMRVCSARGVGENIAYGNVTADTMMAMWMNSAGHRANILRPSYTHIGVGATKTAAGRVYGTQDFLTLR